MIMTNDARRRPLQKMTRQYGIYEESVQTFLNYVTRWSGCANWAACT